MLLLDVNVLTALVMGEHVHHRAASDWYLDNKRRGFLLCSMTQLGVILEADDLEIIPTGRSG